MNFVVLAFVQLVLDLFVHLRVHVARTSLRQNYAFSVVGPLTSNGLPLELRLFSRTDYIGQISCMKYLSRSSLA